MGYFYNGDVPIPMMPPGGMPVLPYGARRLECRRGFHGLTHGGTPMKLEGQEESSNVEDRRGIGLKGGAALGGGATILVIIVSLLLHKDPGQVASIINGGGGGGQPQQQPIDPAEEP